MAATTTSPKVANRSGLDGARGWRLFVRPCLAGALYLTGLCLAALEATLHNDQVQGVAAPTVRRLITTQFAGEVIDAALISIACAVLLGLAMGAVAGGMVRLRDWARGTRRSLVQITLPSLVVVVIAHGILCLHDIAKHPQAYATSLYGRGGLRGALQVFACDWLGPNGSIALGCGLAALWFASAFFHRLGRPPGKAIAVTAGVVALMGLSAGLPRMPSPCLVAPAHAADGRANVLIIAVDSLRADRIDPRVAPHLVDLAQGGTQFDRAYVSLPRTFPSWVSILTGRYPHHHGIRHMFPRWEPRTREVGAIPRQFGAAGYHTAVVSDFAGDIFRRMDLGFATTHTPTFNMRELVREVVVGGQAPLLPMLRSRTAARLLPVLRELHDTTDPVALTHDIIEQIDNAKGRPFFVVGFYSTTHFPYPAPAPHASRFLDPNYRGPYRFGKMPGVAGEHTPAPSDIQAIRSLYDGSVAATDDAIAELVRQLRSRGLDRNTIVVVTADHGESIYEAGRGQGHGDHLFGDEVTHVPLLIIDPRHHEPRRVPDVVRSIDIAPTLCQLAGVACASGMDGRSLVDLMEGKPQPARMAFGETGLWFTRKITDVPLSMRIPYPDLTEVLEVDIDHDGDLVARKSFEPLLVAAKHRMVRDERYKLVYVPTRRGVQWMLFDTQTDPQETTDVAKGHPQEVERMQRALWDWMLQDPRMQRRGGALVPTPAQELVSP